MKRILTILIVFTLLFNINSSLYTYSTETGSLTDIYISEHNGLSSSVYEGDPFDLTLKLLNRSGETLKNIYVTVLDNGSFYPDNRGSNIFVADELTNGIDTSISDSPIRIIYTGGSNQRLTVKITYTKNDEVLTVTDYIGIRTAKLPEPKKEPEVDTTKNVPRLAASTPSNFTIEAGKNVSLPITIKNSSNHSAQNIVITPSFDGQVVPIEFTESTSNSISSISANGSREYKLDFFVNPTAEEKTYQLKLSYKFTNSHGNPFDSSETLFIKIVNRNTFPKFSIQEINLSPSTTQAGETVTLGFTLQNIGSLGAKDVKITLNGLKTNGLTILNSSNVKHITRILGGNQNYISYVLHASDKIESGLHDIDIHLEYRDDSNTKHEETHKVFIPVNNSKISGSKSIPKLIIDQYVSSPTMVKAGQNYNLNLSFFNTHSEKAVQNIKIYLTVDEKTETSGNVFTPVNSSNTFFIDYIEPKSVVDRNIQLYTVPDAKQKTYTILANFEYEDLEGNEYKASELIGIPVIQPTRLETSELSIPPFEAYVGQPFPVSLEFYNMGKVTLYNLMVKTEGNFSVENGNYFVGNFESGNNDYYEAYVTPTSPGQLEGSIVFTYDDPAGEKIEIRKDFSVNVLEMHFEEMPPDFQEKFPPESNSKKTLIWASSGVSLLLAMAVAIFLIRKRKNKEKGMFLDE
ncbi:COG1361 S-layer family protein [Serpentinicella alkaliphila]|uniref:CARDB protein n=1 Tax=Serpentinicella alkaliphila TaxID=1734049 RepID=A0A4R2TIF3_9FIRM|nr:hypothetical protein [Serpentinicella alkaliphila]QUH25947.1 hypothetical protein HZR23_09505 [Serpentinicella alkaliphila]TCQ02052.1 hypothetical protein EDD79_101925 [Serpentinicella alkaliphila]